MRERCDLTAPQATTDAGHTDELAAIAHVIIAADQGASMPVHQLDPTAPEWDDRRDIAEPDRCTTTNPAPWHHPSDSTGRRHPVTQIIPRRDNPGNLPCTATRHGDYSAYGNYDCRCPAARDDHRLYYKRRREGRAPARIIPALGTQRRIRALAALGHPLQDIGARLGIKRARMCALLRQDAIRVVTAEKVAALYAELSMVPGGNNYAAGHARARGWAPPLAWDDDTIDDPTALPNYGQGLMDEPDTQAIRRAINGEQVPLTVAERQQAIHELQDLGYEGREIAARLGISARTVYRHARFTPSAQREAG